MAMFVHRFARHRKNVVVTVRNKNNKVTTNFQKLIKTIPNTTSRRTYTTKVSSNKDTSISKSNNQ